MKSEALIFVKPLRHPAQPSGIQALKKSSIKVNTLSVSILDSRKKSVWFMQVLALARLPLGETFLERIVTQAVLRDVKQRR